MSVCHAAGAVSACLRDVFARRVHVHATVERRDSVEEDVRRDRRPPAGFRADYGLGKWGWVTATIEDGDGLEIPVELFEAWIDESYRKQAPKKLLRELEARGAGARGTGARGIGGGKR